MKYYSVDIQVDFDTPRDMQPRSASEKPWRAIGYLQYFLCTEKSKENAKQLVLNHVRKKETNPDNCKFNCDRIAWMRDLKNREQLSTAIGDLNDEMFAKRDHIGIWYCGEKEYFISEADYAASLIGKYVII
ncbi:MAG: hypothetical protein ABFR82_10520 [Nitrospirota bacterium]